MINKIYIAGKVTGLTPEQYHRNFNNAKEIVKLYFPEAEIIVPTDICDDNWSWTQSMNVCIDELWNCNIVVFMEGWEDSHGASIERKLAQKLNIPILDLVNNKLIFK